MADDRSREATNGARERNRIGRRHSGRVTRADIEAQMQSARADLTAQVRATRATIDATNERINARTGRNLAFAVLIGLILGVTMIVSLVLVKELFLIVAGLLIAFTSLELATAMRAAGRDVPRIPTVAVAVAVVPITYVYGPQGQWFAILGAIAVVTLWRLAELLSSRHRAPAASVAADLGAGAFIQVYVSLLGSFAVLLTQQENGQFWTMAFLLLVVVCDIGAYASGLSFGKHPMAPTISPKKTWEGFAGAVVAALVSGVLLAVLLLDQSWYFGLLFGAVIVVTATLGDLAESLLKRDLGIKDISSWLPGHGGLLDRLDSILPSAVAAYVLFLIFA
ncbi:phosphatidate cytidylyltransferase [Planctomonas psychrotolerans]|uniref:phosphatidate cytidylyltransferase n=1 Tax=Planctomonas psychrotolerans TaxID=2528712 RepID=UPI001238D565|nr:phosphatidate cytidylyltransferase [Planctomonas psychrotolerans]